MRRRLAIARLALRRLAVWGLLVSSSWRLGRRGATVVTALWWGRLAVALLRRRGVVAWWGTVGLLRILRLLVTLWRLAICAVGRFYKYRRRVSGGSLPALCGM